MKKAICSFLLSLVLCSVLVVITLKNRVDLEALTMEQIIMEKTIKIEEVISKLLYKTQSISALVIQNDGEIENFDRVAATIVDDPSILNVLAAPSGVVSHVYPLQGNESVVGLDLLRVSEGRKEALLAKETGQLVFDGPLQLVQGGQALVGRLPVYTKNREGIQEFWGLVSVTVKYPQALDGAGLDALEKQGFAYEIWRINPDNGEKQIIAYSDYPYNKQARYIEMPMSILNADWYFRISPVHKWYEYTESWLLIFISLCISLLIAVVVLHNHQLKSVKFDMERQEQALRDALTTAREASEMKSAFLANMSHEIRTPMNGILGFSELAMDSSDVSPKTREYLDKIRISAEGLMQIIDDILDISKIEAGKMELEHTPFHLNELIKFCEMVCSPKAAEKGLLLYCYSEPLSAKLLQGDPVKLRQILLNLLSNAIKFTDQGHIKLMSMVEKSSGESVTLYFEVADSGIGMTPAQIEKICEPFAQADSSTVRQYGGTGLGLSIAKSMVELMGGELKIESQPGAGSTFSFTLTFEISSGFHEITGTVQADEYKKPIFKGDVLVCEDNIINQQVICEHLLRIGLHTAIAENGAMGIGMVKARMLEEKPFDLILVDIHMPVMDGLEMTKKLKEMENKTPIIALTANVMANDRAIYRKLGMVDCLPKPFNAHKLWACLLRYLTPIEFTTVTRTTGDEEDNLSIKSTVINRALGIERAAGNEELYELLLANFVKDNQSAFKTFRDAFHGGDIKLTHRMSLTLMSTAGMIGATRLANAAHEVGKAFSAGTPCTKEQMDTLEMELGAVLEELKPFIKETKKDEQQTGALDRTKALALCETLVPLLETGNTKCWDFLDEIKEVLSPVGEQAALLMTQMEDYEFELAFETANEIKRLLEG